MDVMYVSWNRVVSLCYRLGLKIIESGYRPDAIVAVLRGGVVPSLILSDVLGVDNYYVVRVKHWGIGGELYSEPRIEYFSGEFKSKRLLVVDEVVDTGKTLKRVVDELKDRGAIDVKSAVLFVKPTTIYLPNYYVVKLDKWIWIFFPWSLVETLYSLSNEGERGHDLVERALRLCSKLHVEFCEKELLRESFDNYS